MAKAQLEFLLALDNTKFNKAINASRIKMVSTGKKMADGLDPVINKLKVLRAGAANVALGGVVAGGAVAAAGLYKLNNVMRESIELANTQEQAETKLAAVIKATGGSAGFTAGELNKYAGELQGITTYGDEATISAMGILATFKQIKGDQFKEATKAAMDMSTVMDQDLNSSIVQIGKALNDPVAGMSALSRVGVTFTDSQKEMIKSLQASGDVMVAQKIILAELQSQFGGAATAARDTFGGASTAAANALGDLKEEVGFAVTKNQFFVESMKIIESQFVTWTAAIKANGPAVQAYAKDTTLGFLSMGETALTAMDWIYRGANGVAGIFQGVAAASLMVSSGIFKILAAGASLTDWLGITENAAAGWKTEAAAAFDASVDLANQANKNLFTDMANGSTKIQAAADALGSLREKMEEVPTGELEGIESGIGKASAKTEEYEEELIKVNGVWQLQKEAVEEVEPHIQKIIDDLESLQGKTVTMNVVQKVVEAKQAGGVVGTARYLANGGSVAVKSMLSGGAFPGYGGGDRRHVVAEDGEVMIRKESVKAAGLKTALAFNAGRFDVVAEELSKRFNLSSIYRATGGMINNLSAISLPPLPAPQILAAGGAVTGTQQAAPVYNLNVSFAGNVAPASQQTARQQARMMLNEFDKMVREGAK